MVRTAWSLAFSRSSGDNLRNIATKPSSTSERSPISGLWVMGNRFPLVSRKVFRKNKWHCLINLIFGVNIEGKSCLPGAEKP
jgi:hypothetical protein